jgi:hypothetical protein
MGMKADWLKHIENWQRSGLSQAAYCRQHDLTYQHFTAQLAAYRKIVKKAKAAVTAQSQLTTFVPVQVEPPVVAAPSVLAESSVTMTSERMVYCHADGHRLELPLSVPAAWVAELLKCLG